MNLTDEEGKAAQEVAKAVGKGIDAGRELGGFVSRFVDSSLKQAMGIVEDKLSYMRWERQVRLMRRVEETMDDLGMDGPSRSIPMKVAIPLFQAASLEENDSLQDLWVKLLVNAADANRGVEIQRAYISIVEDFGSLEASIMKTLYRYTDRMLYKGPFTKYLPSQIGFTRPPQEENLRPTPDVEVALVNLCRLGCLSPSAGGIGWEGWIIVSQVYPTPLGRALFNACTLRGEADEQLDDGPTEEERRLQDINDELNGRTTNGLSK